MRIISINVNGIRAAARKGLFTWLQQQAADVICLQEIKAKREQLDDSVFHPQGYFGYFFPAQKPGYSGTAIYSRHQPQAVYYGLGWASADEEGRYLQIDFKRLSVASIYLPSGSSAELRQAVKFDFMARYQQKLETIRRQRRQYIICGDWNIVHREIDIANFKANQKNSGCLPEERAWFDQLLTKHGFVDAFRQQNQQPRQYSWWSNRGQAWAKNVGWRIDYQIITPSLADSVTAVDIYKTQRFSDHAPVIVDYNDQQLMPLL